MGRKKELLAHWAVGLVDRIKQTEPAADDVAAKTNEKLSRDGRVRAIPSWAMLGEFPERSGSRVDRCGRRRAGR